MTVQPAPEAFPFDAYVRCPLRGDASARSYARLMPRAAARRRALEPAIEMTFGGTARAADVQNFVAATRLFQTMRIPVASILHVDEPEGCVVVEDLGDVLLSDAAASRPFPRHLYETAVETLLAIQVRSRGCEGRWPAVFARALDANRIAFELDFLKRHGLEHSRGLGPAEARAVESAFAVLIAQVAKLPRVLNHRDYHARNIMVAGLRIAIVDYQDALMASPFYDLASLLRDSYVEVPADAAEALYHAYVAGARSAALPVPAADGESRRQFEAVALQRNVKALGTFAYQGLVRGRRYFLDSIPKTLSDIRRNPAARAAALEPLVAVLEDRLGGLP